MADAFWIAMNITAGKSKIQDLIVKFEFVLSGRKTEEK